MSDRKVTMEELYSDYRNSIREKENIVTERYSTCDRQIKYIFNILYPYNQQLLDAGIDLGFESEVKMKPNSKFYSEKKLSAIKINVITIDENLIKSYISAYCRSKLRMEYYDAYLKRLQRYKIPYRIYRTIIKSHNRQIARKLLNGYIYTVGETVGQIYIKKIRRIFSIQGKEATKNIDWGETKKLRKRLLDAGHSLYNPDTNPNGKKYLVYYDSDYMYWYWWQRRASNIPNHYLYTFTPTNFINTADRSQLKFVKEAKTKDDIIDSELLGNRDKLYCLVRFDPSHGLNYITDERTQISK
jgi:hypothetical protein